MSANPCETDTGRINKYYYIGYAGGSFWNFIRFRGVPGMVQNLSVIFASLDATSPKGVRPWQAVRAKPLCHACGVPPPLIRGGFAAVKFYRNTVCYCETKSLCQWLPFSGELSSGCETERAIRLKWKSRTKTAFPLFLSFKPCYTILELLWVPDSIKIVSKVAYPGQGVRKRLSYENS